MSKARELANLGNQIDDGAITGSNMVVNGAMTISQRGAGPFTNASGGYQTVDRFQLSGTMGGSFTLEQVSDAPSGSGFNKSFKALAPTGFSSPTASASAKIATSIESQNLQHLMYGSSNAVTVTVSFWVKATVTGTYIFEFYGDDTNRTISTAYTISTSNTWEKKIITIDGDVSGTINNDNGSGLTAQWWIGAGSNFTSGTLQTAWGSYTAANRAVGQVNGVASNNDAFYLTGVQLEVGDTATPFEHRSYGDELARCQRYYQVIKAASGSEYRRFARGHVVASTLLDCSTNLFVEMRTFPTLATTGTPSDYAIYHGNTVTACSTTPNLNTASDDGAGNLVSLNAFVASGLTLGQGATLLSNNSTSTYLAFDAEL
jgi:hypothetical protein